MMALKMNLTISYGILGVIINSQPSPAGYSISTIQGLVYGNLHEGDKH
jgi:hypothetical protein